MHGLRDAPRGSGALSPEPPKTSTATTPQPAPGVPTPYICAVGKKRVQEYTLNRFGFGAFGGPDWSLRHRGLGSGLGTYSGFGGSKPETTPPPPPTHTLEL